MFIGSINQHLRSIIAELAQQWRGLPVYVGCSGNFTIERLLVQAGVAEVHGNDVSLYSCLVGAHLAGRPFRVEVKDDGLRWLEPFLQPGLPAIAALLVCTSMLEFFDRDTPYHRRMAAAYRQRFPELHEQTVKRVAEAIEGVRLASFYAGDVVDFLAAAPQQSVVISFPPTYKGGYERLYKRLAATFSWDEPSYTLFTAERFAALVQEMQKRSFWVVSRDAPLEDLAAYCVGEVQTGLRSKKVHVYANAGKRRLALAEQKVEPVPTPRLQGEPTLPLTIASLSQGQLNTLRSEYLSPKITPASTSFAFGVLAGGQLIGAVAFGPVRFGTGWDVYMMTDLAVPAPPEARLAKLVLAVVLSQEMKRVLEERMAKRVEVIGTTAFTDKPVSMKYRGLFELVTRKPGMLNYEAHAGRWSLEEGFTWWQRSRQKASTSAD